MLATQHSAHARDAIAAAIVCGACFGALYVLARYIARLEAQAKLAEAAKRQAEQAAAEAIAERDRATKLEQALLHMQRLESIGRLAGGVAHDFNNLLTVIGASASMAERALASGASPAGDLREVHEAVGRASELTKRLLTFARKQLLVKRSVDLNALVSSLERMLLRLLGDSGMLSAKLSSEPLRVLADGGQLEQVIVNLVINARDAIAAGGHIELVTSRLTLSGRQSDIDGLAPGDYACVEVRDDGSGMADEVQRRLFEPFFTTKPHGRGTGLGLATSFGIVRQHEGSIRVDSRPGAGTSMRVLLPLATALEAGPQASGVVPVAAARRRVLVVEDEPQVRAVAVRALSGAGFEVLQAGNGALALALMKEQTEPIDLIVTDVVMPELSGLELARAVRLLDPSIQLLFMSGFPEALQGASANELRGSSFLAKPFAPQELVELVRERLANQSARSA